MLSCFFTVTKNSNADNGQGSHVERFIFSNRSSCVSSLLENIDVFCKTSSELEQKKLEQEIHAKLHVLSVTFTNSCKICPAECKLRTFMLGNDTLNVNKGIGIYVSILSVMLQHGLQPQLNNKVDLEGFMIRLKTIVEPPNFFPMTRVRRDIETVIKMLSAFEKLLKEEKIKYAIELVGKIKEDRILQKTADKFLKKYLGHQSWTRDYLVISWLKIQVIFCLRPCRNIYKYCL